MRRRSNVSVLVSSLQHIVIRRPEFVAGSREKPEIGVFTQAHSGRRPSPWGRIDAGETVWMKWSGGPVVGRARVEGFAAVEACTPDRLRGLVRGYKLYDLDDYWSQLRPSFFGMAIYVRDEQWLDPLLDLHLGPNRESWVVLDQELIQAAVTSIPSMPDAAKPNRRKGLSQSLRFEVLRRDSFTCRYCGRSAPGVVLHIDHVVPVVAGGDNSPDNLATACEGCNLGKGATLLDTAKLAGR